MSKVLSESGLRIVITVSVGLIGAAVGFKHTHDWAEENGQKGAVAWAIAVVVECMAIVASLELRRKRGVFPLLTLVAAFLLQMAAQVAGARPTFAGWLLAATPALGFLVIVKFALRAAEDAESVAEVRAAASVPAARVDQPKPESARVPEPEPVRELVSAPVVPAQPAPVMATWPPSAAA